MNEVPESDEVLRHVLHDQTRAAKGLGWTQVDGTDPQLPGVTYWIAIPRPDMYLGVLPIPDKPGSFGWFVTQGKNGDRDKETETLAAGEEGDPQSARDEATMYYNRNRNIPDRR